jgi:hypothetical protein
MYTAYIPQPLLTSHCFRTVELNSIVPSKNDFFFEHRQNVVIWLNKEPILASLHGMV